MPGIFDHLLAALLVVVWPAFAVRNGRREMRELAEDPSGKTRAYRQTMLGQWIQTIAILVLWIALERDWASLGLGVEFGRGFGIALAVTGLVLFGLARQLRRARRDAEYAARIRAQVAELEGLLPQSPSEVRTFRAMAFTAGFCEELAYRGYMLWYLSAYMPDAAAIAIAVVAFALCHIYQGIRGAAHVAVVALVAFFFYLLSGSLWLPMVLHVAFDLHQLSVVRAAARECES